MSSYLNPRGREIQWPSPRPYIGAGWYQDCRERGPADVSSRGAQAAMKDLRETLASKPATYWPASAAARELSARFTISSATAHQLLRDCPGAVLLEGGAVWCATSAAAGWPEFKAAI
jgi:hypothetical protein